MLGPRGAGILPAACNSQVSGRINVGRLAEIGGNFKANPTVLTVVPMPLEGYPSHAEIPQKISRGLSNEIVRSLAMHREF
jgi:hypothetical protein